jgi:signal transduction histidine kinase
MQRTSGRAVRDAQLRLVQAGFRERRRLERDLHDGAQQRLLALGLRLGAITAGNGVDPVTSEAIEQARTELRQALYELRQLAHGIYPAELTQVGLAPAVETVAERLPVPVAVDIPARRWSAEVEVTAYFVICEALTNAAKHAQARVVQVRAEQTGGDLVVVVIDDGRGNDALNHPTALPHLRDRLGAVGGQLDITSRPGQGTCIQASLPCE